MITIETLRRGNTDHTRFFESTGKRSVLYAILLAHGFIATSQTAFIERLNLTIRQGVALLTRRTWSLAKSEKHLELHIHGGDFIIISHVNMSHSASQYRACSDAIAHAHRP